MCKDFANGHKAHSPCYKSVNACKDLCTILEEYTSIEYRYNKVHDRRRVNSKKLSENPKAIKLMKQLLDKTGTKEETIVE